MASRVPAMLRLLAVLLLTAVATPVPGASAGDPSLSPFLRLDVGRHTAAITRVATDRDETVLVTASLDKTLRVWSPDTGALRGVLRVPIEHGWEGGLYAVAVSPDGRTALAGGLTGDSWDNPFRLYRFNLETMTLNGLIRGMKGVINDLAWSPDGRFVAVGLGSGRLEVREAARLEVVAEDADYASHVTSVSFDGAGRLAAVADDGILRLYAAESFVPLGKVRLPGAHPVSVALSRDGSRIAVGYLDRPQADLFDGRSLKPIGPVPLDGLRGEASRVAWVARPGGGEDLIAGGTLSGAPGRFAVRRWADRSKVRDMTVAGDSVMALLPSRRGGYYVASADSSWGRIGDDGDRTVAVTRVTADFRDAQDGRLALSPNGLAVAFRLFRGARTVYRFDLVERVLAAQPGAVGTVPSGTEAAFAPTVVPDPEADARALKLTGWRNQSKPKLGKRALALGTGEQARGVAALPGGGFVLGADYSLRLYDRGGAELRMVELPAPAWTVAVSRDGRFVVAALGDGTLRWYSLGPGRPPLSEVVSLFVHRDGVRWVAWTPEGFFDQSRAGGGGDLVGFHLNVGRTKTEWMEFERAYRIFYDSEMVTAKLDPAREGEVAQRLALIGDLRQRIAARPEVRILDYCYGDAVETRGVRRTDPAAPATLSPAALPAADAGGVVCVPAGKPETRGVARVAPAAMADGDDPAADTTAAAATADRPPDFPHEVTRLRLRFAVKGEYGTIQVFRNGRNASDPALTRGVSRVAAEAPPAAGALPPPAGPVAAGEDVHEATVLLDSGRNVIDVQVFDKNGATDRRSDALDLVRAAPAPKDIQEAPKRRMFLLAAGINRYKGGNDGFGPLRLARSDAQNFASTIWERLPPTYDKSASVLTRLSDGEASREAIISAIASFRERANPDDLIIIYLAGHGTATPSAADAAVKGYYFITPEVTSDTPEEIRTQALSGADLAEALANRRTGNLLLVLDTCQAGQFASSEFGKLDKGIGNTNIWAASTSTQYAADEYPGSGHGLFFHAISEAVTKGNGFNDEEKIVMMSDVSGVLGTVMRGLTAKMNYEGRQKPVIIQPQGNDAPDSLPLAMRID